MTELTPSVTRFLAAREHLDTGCVHPPVTVAFEIDGDAGPSRFAVDFRDGQASVNAAPDAVVDHVIRTTETELDDILAERIEPLGSFWSRQLPTTFPDYFWASSLYAFLYPNHPYDDLSPAISAFYRESRHWPESTPFTQGHRLFQLVTEHDLRWTLEVGLAWGGSALFITEAHRRRGVGHHFAADPFQFQSFAGAGARTVVAADEGGHFTHLNVMGTAAMQGFRTAGLFMDLIYVDGNHGTEEVRSDFLDANRLLREGGFLALDDCDMASGPPVIDLIHAEFDYEHVPGPGSNRLTVFRKRSHRDGSRATLALDRRARMRQRLREVPALQGARKVYGLRHRLGDRAS